MNLNGSPRAELRRAFSVLHIEGIDK